MSIHICNNLPDCFYRDLDAKEIAEFRQWARENHKAGDTVSGLWHPIVRDECQKIDAEEED